MKMIFLLVLIGMTAQGAKLTEETEAKLDAQGQKADFCPTMEEACRDSNGGVDFCVDTPAAIVAECIYPRRSNFDDACVTFSGCNITVEVVLGGDFKNGHHFEFRRPHDRVDGVECRKITFVMWGVY
ncbi:hypothetical protein Fcan01_26357 [Folsomia candida]|uniref:Uncharacterized protein n=1 Tax=Folsomia candida TaxID=158441 RepID=A0A226D2I7_FOLCA|nr:hypothetical protein Fcan01_26357 [Folsomia candida]